MKITKEINEHIFREYDIRGVADVDLNDDIVYTIGKAFGSYLKKQNKNQTVIGYDNRLSSKRIYVALTKGILDTGINITSLGLVTTPMYYSSWTILKHTSGIMITASHNPKEYNGFKLSFNGLYNAYGEMIQELLSIIKNDDFVDGQGTINDYNIYEEYIEFVTKSIKLGNRPLKVVIDCGNGTASVIAEQVFSKLKINYIPIYCESDGNFPNHHPDPSVENNLTDLKYKVLHEKADIGIAFDGDADRVGIVDEKGNVIFADLFMIIVWRNLMPKTTDKRAIFDVKCTKALEDEIIKLGGAPTVYRTGNSYLRAKIYEDNYLFGGEFSGHVFFNDKFAGYDDGIYAALRMLEILSNTDKNVSELLKGINKYYATAELKLTVDESKKDTIMKYILNYCQNKQYKVLTIDGVKVLFEDGFALIRPSNTGPNITYRYEARSEERLTEISQEFNKLLEESIKKRN